MSKRTICWIALLLSLACNFLFPQPKPANAPSLATLKPNSSEALPSTPEVDSTPAFTIVRIHAQDGDLLTQLAAEAQKAKARNQTPFVEFDATWCPPCVAINASLKAKDPVTLKAFAGVYVVRADVDEWGWGDGTNFKFSGIPIYYKLNGNGKPTGATIDGDAWGDNVPENFAPALDAFFHAR
jgi:thiol-disulfide isomerase/thioredoxin